MTAQGGDESLSHYVLLSSFQAVARTPVDLLELQALASEELGIWRSVYESVEMNSVIHQGPSIEDI